MHRANNFTLASPRSPRKPASPRVKRDEAAAAAARAVYEATSEAPTTLFESSRIDDHDFNELLRENKMLDQRNQTLSHRVDDHEAIVKRMWRRGWAEAPSPRGLRELTTTTVAAAAHERHEADAARELAQRHLREAMRAKADADVAHNHANHASAELEMERERMREWHAGDAQDLTRRMTEMTRAFAAEQVKNATLTHDAERSSEERAAAIGGLVAQLEGSRESQRELARRARAENGELARRLEESTRALEECRMGAYEERRRLEEASAYHMEQARQAEAAREQVAVVHDAMMRNLQDELALSQAENMRLRSELDGARDNYAALSRNSREDKLRMAADNERMNTLITKLDASVGVAAEGGAAGGPGGGAAASAPTASSAAPPFGASVLGAPPFDRLNVPPFAPAMAPDAELLPPPALGLQMIPSAPRSPNRSPKGAAVLGVGPANDRLEYAIRAAEERKSTIARLEGLVVENNQTIADLRHNLALSERLRTESTREMTGTIDKLRWLQSKAMGANGAVTPGRYRSMMYWENMKDGLASSPRGEREVMMSWRGDDDKSKMSQLVDLAHLQARATAGETVV